MDINIAASGRYQVGKGSSLGISLKDTRILTEKSKVFANLYDVLFDEDGQIGKKVAM
jgi:hypothetical protein